MFMYVLVNVCELMWMYMYVCKCYICDVSVLLLAGRCRCRCTWMSMCVQPCVAMPVHMCVDWGDGLIRELMKSL